MPEKGSLRENALFRLIVCRGSWGQECEAAGHISPAASKHGRMMCAFSLWVCTFGVCLLPSLEPPWKCPHCQQSCVS